MCRYCVEKQQKLQPVPAVIASSPSKQILKSGSTLSLSKRLVSENNLANSSNKTSTESFAKLTHAHNSQDNISAIEESKLPIKKSERDLQAQQVNNSNNITLISNILESLDSANKASKTDSTIVKKTPVAEPAKAKEPRGVVQSASKFSLDELLSDLDMIREKVDQTSGVPENIPVVLESLPSRSVNVSKKPPSDQSTKPVFNAAKSASIEDILGEMELKDEIVDELSKKPLSKSLSVKDIINDLDLAESNMVFGSPLRSPAKSENDSLTALAINLDRTFDSTPMPPTPLAEKRNRNQLKSKVSTDSPNSASYGTLALDRLSMLIPAGLNPPPALVSKPQPVNQESNIFIKELREVQLKRTMSSESITKHDSNYSVRNTNGSNQDPGPSTPRANTAKHTGNATVETHSVYSTKKESVSK